MRFEVATELEATRVFEIVNAYGLDVWAENKALGSIDVRFTNPLDSFRDALVGLKYSIIVDNVQRLTEEMHLQNQASRVNWLVKQNGGDFFQSYHTFDEIVAFMKNLTQTYPTLASMEQIGSTVNNNPIYGIRIHSPKGPVSKPLIVYNSLQHAREWISGATTTYILHTLLDGYGKSKTITKIVDSLDWFIVPVVNVDGYKWTWDPAGDRFWRKNRRAVTSSCFGIDINRNWNFQFKPSPLADACKETYAGKAGFSEPENKAIGDFLTAHPQTVAYIDFHSYSQLMMWPWAYQAAAPPHNTQIVSLGNKMVEAIKSVHGTQYTGGQIYEVIYPAYGSSVDYALAIANVTLPYGIELRDTGEYGFALPPYEIIPNGQEIYEAVETMANFIIDNNIKR